MGPVLAKLRETLSKKKIDLCLVGLENSGKTTLLNILSVGFPVETLPTVGLNVKQVKKQGVSMKVWDLGGQERFRKDWAMYIRGCDVIIYVVDASNKEKERVQTARKELHSLLEEKDLQGLPLMIALNKIDLPDHMTKEECIRDLNLDYVQDNPWIVQPMSALKQTHVQEVLEWLVTHSH